MIPKIIHYCWFGGKPLSEMAVKCIESWKKYCPDYEIRRWDETNLDFSHSAFSQEAYDAKKWAFVTDYVRLNVLYLHGGFYFDTDVELIKSLDNLLTLNGFAGTEDGEHINLGQGFGAEAGSPLLKKLIDSYKEMHFIKEDGTINFTPSPKKDTQIFINSGFVPNQKIQQVDDFTVFPTDYFCPIDIKTSKLNITVNTYSIHHFDGSWVPEDDKYRYALRAKLARIMPYRVASAVARFVTITKFNGLGSAVKASIEKVGCKFDGLNRIK